MAIAGKHYAGGRWISPPTRSAARSESVILCRNFYRRWAQVVDTERWEELAIWRRRDP